MMMILYVTLLVRLNRVISLGCHTCSRMFHWELIYTKVSLRCRVDTQAGIFKMGKIICCSFKTMTKVFIVILLTISRLDFWIFTRDLNLIWRIILIFQELKGIKLIYLTVMEWLRITFRITNLIEIRILMFLIT